MEKIRVIGAGQFKLIGQIAYEPGQGVSGVGIRVYQDVDPQCAENQFLCVEDAESGDEAWYRIDETCLEHVSLEGMEKYPRDPR